MACARAIIRVWDETDTTNSTKNKTMADDFVESRNNTSHVKGTEIGKPALSQGLYNGH